MHTQCGLSALNKITTRLAAFTTPPSLSSSKRSQKVTSKKKEQRVLKALKGSEGLCWSDLPDTIGFTTLHRMEKAGLIEQVSSDVGPFSFRARWRLKEKSR